MEQLVLPPNQQDIIKKYNQQSEEQDRNLQSIYQKNAAKQSDAARANNFIDLFVRIIQNKIVPDNQYDIIKLHFFGSYKQKLSQSDSDIDMCLEIKEYKTITQYKILSNILTVLLNEETQKEFGYTFKEGEVIHAKTIYLSGIITYQDKEIKFDLVIDNDIKSVKSSQLLSTYVEKNCIQKQIAENFSLYQLLKGFFEYALQKIDSPNRINILDNQEKIKEQNQQKLLFSFIDPFGTKNDPGSRKDLYGECNEEIKKKFQEANEQLVQNKSLKNFFA